MAEGKPDGYLFTSAAEDLNFGILRTNPASTQGGPPDFKSGTLTTRPCCAHIMDLRQSS